MGKTDGRKIEIDWFLLTDLILTRERESNDCECCKNIKAGFIEEPFIGL
jgi:hypothetical protein